MYSILVFLSLCGLISSTIVFTRDPGCPRDLCNSTDSRNFYYGTTIVNDKKNHIIFSTFGDLTISIFQTATNVDILFNYAALFEGNYPQVLITKDGARPSITNSFSLILSRLIEFNDTQDNAQMNDDLSTTISYYLTDLIYNNITNDNTTRPSFQFDIQNITGQLTIDIEYPGETKRDDTFPKLKVEPSSYFLNIALNTSNTTFVASRFALELFVISPDVKPYVTSKETYIDDQYTPGIFNVWQLKRSGDTLYPSSMLWKPVVYQSDERSVEENTLMQIYDLKSNISWDKNFHKGMFLSILSNPTISAFNVSYGSEEDGYFGKTNYGFVQFTAGLDLLQPDSTASFVTIAAIVSFALPVLVGIVAGIFILRKKFCGGNDDSSAGNYRTLNN